MTSDYNIGSKLANRYLLTDLLGRGSMGRVYAAKDIVLGGVPVAVKLLSQTLLNRKMRDRFEREATTCALLGQKSIHIVRVTDYGVREDDEVPFYVMGSAFYCRTKEKTRLPCSASFCLIWRL